MAFASEALTLGRVRGAALIGKPLDMVVPVQMDAGEKASSLCFDAQVFHADTRQEASRVQVLVEAGAQPNMANVRILSSAAVDEPVVTVYLRSGCGQQTTRRYVLLADLPSEVAEPSVPLVAATTLSSAPAKVKPVAAAGVSASQSTAPVAVNGAKAPRAPRPSTPRNADSKRPQTKAAAASPGSTASNGGSIAARSVGRPRLRLDPLELLSDRVSDLDSYMTFDAPQDALDNIQKVKVLEESVKSLLTLAARNEASLADLRVRLQLAQSDRFSSMAGYALIVLTLVCLTAVALLWSRQRRAQPSADWWGGSIATAAPEADHPPRAADTQQEKHALSEKSRVARRAGPLAEPEPSAGFDVDLMEMSDSNLQDFMPQDARPDARRKPPPSPVLAATPPTGSARDLNPDAILDIRQQAEFFVSLGKTDRAVQILERQIHDSNEPNPFVYLDLLGALHSLGLRTEFQQLRHDFNQFFFGWVPEFASFKQKGRGLESYPDALQHICALWPASQVVTWIESCIFQNSPKANGDVVDLAAFRDLLLLHGVARDVTAAPQPERLETSALGALDLDLSGEEENDHGVSPALAADVDLDLTLSDQKSAST